MRRQDSIAASQAGRYRGVRIVIPVALLALVASGFAAAPAGAAPARFIHEVCDSALPNGGTPDVKLIDNADPTFTGSNTCASPGGSLYLQQTGSPQPTFAIWSVGVPATPGGYVELLAISAIACGLGGGNTNGHVYEVGWPGNNCSESQRLFHVHDGPFPYAPGAGFSIVLNCDGNYESQCALGATVAAHYFSAIEVDPTAPVLSNVRGSLLAGGAIRGTQKIAAEATDKGGGLSEMAVFVNGIATGAPVQEPCAVVSAHNPSVVGKVAVSPTPCPIRAAAEWTLDTQAYPFRDGANTVQVCAFDFATLGEPNRSCSDAQSIDVDNSCTPSAIDGGELLSAHFSASHEDSVTVAYGRSATISGRLATNAGDPVRGATLCVKMQTLGVDSHPASVGTVITDANGAYSYEVKSGPNRQVVIGYRYDSHQLARDVSYYAHVRPSLKRNPPSLPNGRKVHLWGRLPGPRQGERVVVLQANAPGSKRWITFKRATSNGAGAFHSSYRFSSTTRRTRYRFRALVPRQAGYPWIEGHSKPASVTVTP
jgi:hypothetical protein